MISDIVTAIAAHLLESGVRMKPTNPWNTCHLLENDEQLQIYIYGGILTLAHYTSSLSGWMLVDQFSHCLADPHCLGNAARFATSIRRPSGYRHYNHDLETPL